MVSGRGKIFEEATSDFCLRREEGLGTVQF